MCYFLLYFLSYGLYKDYSLPKEFNKFIVSKKIKKIRLMCQENNGEAVV